MCLFIANNVIFAKKWNFTFFSIYYLETNIGNTLGVQSKVCQNCVFHRIIDFLSWQSDYFNDVDIH